MQRIVRFVKDALRRGLRLKDDQLTQIAEEIVGYGSMFSLFLLPDTATKGRTVGADVDDLAFRLRETRDNVTAALALLEKEGRASRTWLDGHWILHLRPEDLSRLTSQHQKDRRSA